MTDTAERYTIQLNERDALERILRFLPRVGETVVHDISTWDAPDLLATLHALRLVGETSAKYLPAFRAEADRRGLVTTGERRIQT